MILYGDALQLIKELSYPELTTEDRPLASCNGHILARDLAAPHASPLFTNSAMDGYAVRHDEAREGHLRVNGVVMAGMVPSSRAHSSGHCMGIMTGAPVPEWADTVVPVELTSEADGVVQFKELPPPGANIRRRGSDIQKGAPLLKAGCKLTPERLMALASFGFDKVPVQPPPQLVIATSGDEVVDPGVSLEPARIYNSNKYFLSAAASKIGLPARECLHLKDDPAKARDRLRPFLEPAVPTLLVSTGAVSAGERDFIPSLATDAGLRLIFHKVAIRPGKPVFLAKSDKVVWLGLPGNPISTCVGWHFFARPLLEAWVGVSQPRKAWVKLKNEVRKPEGLRCFYRAEVNGGKAWIPQNQGSAMLASSLSMDAYVELPEGRDLVSADTQVEATFCDG